MSEAPYRAMGGCVVTDHGFLALANARRLSGFYALEAASPGTGGRWRRLAAQRSQALALAVEDAGRWRRAAGWTDPEAADQR
jgi:hypothetical protein